jgi:pimeloyl-ACP methyl ester carboxylesterase
MTRTYRSASGTLSLAAVTVAIFAAFGCASGARAPEAAASLETAPSRFATLDGNRIHYKSVGSGREALVLVHGWSGDLNAWRFQVPELARRARVIVLDLPGHGASDKPQTAYSMDFFARAVDAVMRDAGVDRAVLAGHSMGTPIIRQFYRLYPEKTLGLIAVDGALQNLYSGMLDPVIVQLRGPGYKDVSSKFIASMFPNPGTEALRDATLATTAATPQYVMVGSFEGMRDPAVWNDDPIRVPLLVVNAKASFWTSEYVEYVRKLAPQVDYRVIEGTGHFVQLEKPRELNAAILEFLEKNGLLRA